VTLTGSGGVGKTRLAGRLAADVLDRFPGGVWWVDLASLRDPRAIGTTVLAAVGAAEDGSRPAIDVAVDRLAGAPALVVFDNCEHVVAAAADAVDALRRACPDLVVRVEP
jgi:non-specific serine/threonine protein kinase